MNRPLTNCGLRMSLLSGLLASLACSQSLIIERVTVIDATGREAQSDMNVVVTGDRIGAIRHWKRAKVPKGTRVVDGTGKFLIPGLWDMHVHGATDERASWSHLLFLANGVVGVRDMAGPPDARAWRVQHASFVSTDGPSPSIYLGSPIVDGPSPVWAGSIVAANEAQGREVVAQQQQRGADFIKVYSRLPRDSYFAIADEAKKRGIPFEGHVPESVTAAEASDAGQKSIEHLTRVELGCSKEAKTIDEDMQNETSKFRAPSATMADKMNAGKRLLSLDARTHETYDEADARALFAKFVANGTWQCPTLTEIRGRIDDPLPNETRLQYLSSDVRSSWDGQYTGLPKQVRSAMIASAKLDFEAAEKLVGAMQRAGVSILAGTDTMNPQCFPGFGLHDELALLVESGLSPLAALQSATRNAAQFIGQLDRRGTIEPGKIADLVLLSKDPLSDIHNTRSVEAVILDGKLIERAALQRMLAEAKTLASRPGAKGPGERN